MASSDAPATPALGGKAYPIIDHTYDVVVVGAGGAACAPRSAWRQRV